jgi:hypothetical protein
MSIKERHPNTCPTCDYFPCQCLGGSNEDDEKNSKSENPNAEKIQNNRPAWCIFFAENAKQTMSTSSSNLQEDDDTTLTFR